MNLVDLFFFVECHVHDHAPAEGNSLFRPKSVSAQVVLPQLKVVSPQLKVVSPQIKDVSPQLKVVSPQLKVVSPQLKVVSPQLEVVSPQLSRFALTLKSFRLKSFEMYLQITRGIKCHLCKMRLSVTV